MLKIFPDMVRVFRERNRGAQNDLAIVAPFHVKRRWSKFDLDETLCVRHDFSCHEVVADLACTKRSVRMSCASVPKRVSTSTVASIMAGGPQTYASNPNASPTFSARSS